MLGLFTAFASGELRVTMGLTLFLRGTVVSGVLIGGDRWLELWEQAVSVPGNDHAETFTRSLREQLTPTDGGNEPVQDGYIHLCDAVHVSGGKVLRAALRGRGAGGSGDLGWAPGT